MTQYTGFAYVYDMFMDNVPYDKWTEYLHKLLKEYNIKDGLVCELGCGTGNITRRLRDLGYDMIGIDLSPDMLQMAMEKETDNSILYLNQDMREFELYGSVAAIVSICDSMNYILDEEDLFEVFRLAENYIDPNGMFIFDMNTEYYYKHILGERTICETRDEGSFIWENYYDEETSINEFDMTIYAKLSEDKNDDAAGKKKSKKSNSSNSSANNLYQRFDEVHEQKAYKISTVKRLLKKAGFGEIECFAAGTKEAPTRTTERVYFVAKRIRQQEPV